MIMPEDDDDDDHKPNPRSFSKIQREAIIMERLTSSPHIVSTFGHCALSILSETMPYEVSDLIVPNSGHARQPELDQLPDVMPVNNYTAEEKLDIALEMAHAIADIHGFPGVIVHGDVHPVQWLRSSDGTLKLNDFNNAEILDWSREMQDYCKTDRGAWGGMVRLSSTLLCT
jgi:serine/threonine protein kinase